MVPLFFNWFVYCFGVVGDKVNKVRIRCKEDVDIIITSDF